MEEHKKLSVSQCREILKKNGGKKYTDEQILQIREVLYLFAELDYQITMNKSNATSRSKTEPLA
jgi:hypothetical protein